jgi:hypothetical protein
MKNILLLICLLLHSCVYVSTSGVLDNVGYKQPAIEVQKSTSLFNTCRPKQPSLWKKGDLYYVELPVVYVPMDCDLISVRLWHGIRVGSRDLSYAEAFAEQSEAQIYYAELTKNQLQLLMADAGEYDSCVFGAETIRLLRSDSVDMRTARRVKLRNEEYLAERARVLLSSLPHERTIGNQLRRPLTWALEVVDIPLSAGATVVGWGLMILLGPFV